MGKFAIKNIISKIMSMSYSQCFANGGFSILSRYTGASLVVQRLKRLPAMQETWFQSLGQEDPLEKEMATQSSILAWRIPWTEEPGRLQSSRKKSDMTK